MKRDVPATPFKVGPNSTWTSPENPVGQLATMTQAGAQEVAAMTTLARRGQRSSSSNAGGAAQQGGSTSTGQQIPPSLHQYNTQNVQNLFQQQVNQVDPEQLEQLLDSLVRARVENSYHQMREAARQEVEHIRQQAGNDQRALQDHVLERLQQLQHEKQTVEMREQQNTEQAKQRCEQVQQQADVRIAQMAESNRQLKLELHEVQKAAEGQVAYVARQAELDRDRAEKELQMLGAKLEAAHQQLKNSERVASIVGSISGSPCVGNPFDHPLPHTQSAQHTEIMSVGPGASVASISPLEVMFCSCCGSQNVVGRPSCWRCSTLFSAVVANNGADQNLWQGDRIGATSCPPPSLSPSESFRFRGAGAASASIANAAAGTAQAYPLVGSASIGAPTGILASGGLLGGAGVGSGGAPSVIPVDGHCNLVQGGPRIQGGYIVPTAKGTGQGEVKSTIGGHVPSNPGVAEFAIQTPRNPRKDSSSNGSSSSQGLIGDNVFQPPKDGWLPEGKSEEDVYKLEHLKSVVVTRLPNDATSCRECRAAFLASISRIDLSKTDVLVKWATYAMEGRGKAFRNSLQTSEDFIMLNKHIAAELIKPEVLSTNVELAHEITSWVEGCAARAEGPKGTPLLNLIIAYYETGLDRAVALGQMHLLNLQLEGKGIKELEEFVKKVNYVLHGLKTSDSIPKDNVRVVMASDQRTESSETHH